MTRFMSRDLMVTVLPGSDMDEASQATCAEPSCPTPSNPGDGAAYEASTSDLAGLQTLLRTALG